MSVAMSPAPCLTRLYPALLLVLLALAGPLAAPLRADTSEACLRGCLADCARADAAAREACLRACLKRCPVHCGTVETDCALGCVRGSGPGAEEPAVLAGRCAQACVVKPDCPPPAPTPPAPAQPTTVPSSAAASPSAHSGQGWRAFEPRGRQFRLALPPGWSVEQNIPAAPGAEFELALQLPGEALLDYSRISVRHMASAHRTVERALYVLRHPPFASPTARAAALEMEIRRETLSPGVEAWVAERSTERGLLGLADRVPVRKRTVIVPRPVGYFTLTLDAPEAMLSRVLPVFERLAREFRPLAGAGARGPELSAAEREVWAAFFAARGKPPGGKPGAAAPEASAPTSASGRAASGQAVSGAGPAAQASALDQLAALAQASQAVPAAPGFPDESLRALADTGRSRLVAGRTLAAPGLEAEALAGLVRGCGDADAPDLLRAWDAVRGQRVLVTDAFFAPDPDAGEDPGLEVEEEPEPQRPAKGRKAAKPLPAAAPDVEEPDELAAPAELTARMSGAEMGRLSPLAASGRLFSGGRAGLSRVAFSPDGSLALAYVALRGVSPGTSHFVLFRRAGAPVGEAAGGRGWAICGASLRDYIIY